MNMMITDNSIKILFNLNYQRHQRSIIELVSAEQSQSKERTI